ncbi:MAG: DNA-binding protein WhiA [Eubacterium sp.]
MSFSSEVKNEISHEENPKKSCQLAEIAAIIRVSGSIALSGGSGTDSRFRIIISTDNPAVARHYKRLIKDYFRVDAGLEVGESESVGRKRLYLLTIGKDDRPDQILRETGILLVREGNNYISDGIYENIVKAKADRKAYLRGLFLGAGSVTDPSKGYHLEIVCSSRLLAEDVKKLIGTFEDLSAKIVERKGKYVVYMKSAGYIRDTLAIMGANTSVLKFDDTMMKRQMLAETVRITNCDSANIDRTLDAAQKQIEAIRKLEKNGALAGLSPKLREMARLRVENPGASLTALGEMADPPLKKAGVNSRLNKILEAAERIGTAKSDRG